MALEEVERMGSFLYFVRGAKGEVPLATLESVGLQHAFERMPTSTDYSCELGDGCLLWDDSANIQPRYMPEHQAWVELNDQVSVGMYLEHRPEPEILQREMRIGGYWLTLGGSPWVVPLVRMVDGETLLPRRVKYEHGHWVPGGIDDRFRELRSFCDGLHDAWLNTLENDAPFTVDDPYSAAVRIMSANYRVGPVEVSMLEWFTFEQSGSGLQEASWIIMNAIDATKTAQAFKKKQADRDGLISTVGVAD